MNKFVLFMTLIIFSFLGQCHCHGEETESSFGNNDHPHYFSGPVKTLDKNCMEDYANKPFMSSNQSDDEMSNRASRSSGDCKHVTEEVNFGPDITGSDMIMNISSCKDTSQGYSAENDQGFCYSRKTLVHRITLPNETKNIKSAKFCKDMRENKLKDTCRRLKKTEVYYLDALEHVAVQVDVGHCGGTCDNGISYNKRHKCRPTGYKKVAVPGPNGEQSVSVITDCDCVPSCYRRKHYELYRFSTNETCIEKYIDIGQCAGECSGVCNQLNRPWSPRPGVPFSQGSLSCLNPKCIAGSYTYYYIEEVGINVPVINDCRCNVDGYIVD